MQCLRLTALRPPISQITSTRTFASTPSRLESQRKRVARLKKAKNIARRAVVQQEAAKARPHPVLGLSEANAHVWKETKLYKTLVKPEDLVIPETTPSEPGTSMQEPLSSRIPVHLAFGLKRETVRHLVETLPTLTKSLQVQAQEEKDKRTDENLGMKTRKPYDPYNYVHQGQGPSWADCGSEALLKIIDLRNTNKPGIAYENRRRIVDAFQDSSRVDQRKGPDTGRPEVQAALLTYQLRNLWEHLSSVGSRDVHGRRAVQLLVHQRAKILKYLRRTDPIRYELCLIDIGVEKDAVEGEIIVR